MKCSRGEANPSAATRIRLFADSAGYCQNPACAQQLFVETDSGEPIHFAEMAHIFAASDDGPRSNVNLTNAERGSYDNLILLCANCHTTIDKAPADYPDTMIKQWKRDRSERLAHLFGVRAFLSRGDVLAAIEPLLTANRVTLETYGPASNARFDLESDIPVAWRRKMLGSIIPNNKRVLAILDTNRGLMFGQELMTLEAFRQHTDDLIARHLAGADGGQRFPEAMNQMMVGDG
jgi:HNH endonuclease